MIIVTGAKGQLGGDVCALLKEKGVSHIGIDREEVDITDKNAVENFFCEKNFDVMIHCAAYTAVDKAEEESELCFKINAEGTENLAEVCKEKNAVMIYISTDYVYGGEGTAPFETNSAIKPLSVYGKSKALGEKAVQQLCGKFFILRTSWVFGEENRNFVATMLRLSQTRDEICVVNDQIGSPTYSKHLARLILEMTGSDAYGIYHATNEGFCSWYDFAKKTFEIKNIGINLKGIPTEEYKTAAVRPKNSRLDKTCLDKAGFRRLPHWEEALKEYLANI